MLVKAKEGIELPASLQRLRTDIAEEIRAKIEEDMRAGMQQLHTEVDRLGQIVAGLQENVSTLVSSKSSMTKLDRNVN